MKIILPCFKLREYQKKVLDAFFLENIKRFINVWHRRSGKDLLWFNLLFIEALRNKGNYLYLLPNSTQARKVIWNNIVLLEKNNKRIPVKMLDLIPREVVISKSEKDMIIRLINGSTIQLGGADYYDNYMGTNPRGVVFSEFSLIHPLAWDMFRPILSENNGFAAFILTPRGENHAYDLFQKNKDNNKWYVNLLTIDDTKKINGDRVISLKQYQEEIDSGMPEEIARQEFYCEWLATITGYYFTKQLQEAKNDNRIFDFPIIHELPVYTSWDLGIDDKTAIWFWQIEKNNIRAIHYYENNNEALSFYVRYLQDFSYQNKIFYGLHILPHDGNNRELISGINRVEKLLEMGLKNVHVVPKIKRKIDAINLGRNLINKIFIHKTNCQLGLYALQHYHAEYNYKLKIYKDKPTHDWSSHCVDSFLTMAQFLDSDENFLYRQNIKKARIKTGVFG